MTEATEGVEDPGRDAILDLQDARPTVLVAEAVTTKAQLVVP